MCSVKEIPIYKLPNACLLCGCQSGCALLGEAYEDRSIVLRRLTHGKHNSGILRDLNMIEAVKGEMELIKRLTCAVLVVACVATFSYDDRRNTRARRASKANDHLCFVDDYHSYKRGCFISHDSIKFAAVPA